MKEANFQTQFGKRNSIHGVFELKFTKGKSIPFNALAEHQEKTLFLFGQLSRPSIIGKDVTL